MLGFEETLFRVLVQRNSKTAFPSSMDATDMKEMYVVLLNEVYTFIRNTSEKK